MADKQQKPQTAKPLRPLLNSVYEVHRNDIKTYTSGHLNPGKLLRREQERHVPWESSNWEPKSKQKVEIVNHPVRPAEDKLYHKEMKDALIEFSLGPVGTMNVGVGASSSVIQVDGEGEDKKEISKESVNIEELHLPEIMIPVAVKDKQGKASPQQYKNTFIQSYLNKTTKSDQFASFKEFEDKVIQLGDANDRGVLTGEKTVKMLKNKLSKRLSQLDSMSQRGPNFHKLQIYTDIWQEIISNSKVFGNLLQRIKNEYDNYMSHLLDTQRPSQHRLLYNHLESLSQDQTVTDQLKMEQERVANLEKEALALLEEKERLKLELEEEESVTQKALENQKKALDHPKVEISMEDVPKDLEEQVNDLHVQIMDKLDELKSIKEKQRQDFVPSSVCRHLEQCVKETEVDIQKLIKQNEFLEQSIEELEKELEALIDKSKSDDSAARKLWRKINTMDVLKLTKRRSTMQ